MRITLTIFLAFLFLLSEPAAAREWFYYGANGRQVNSVEEAVMKKEVRAVSGSRYRVRIHVLAENEWRRLRTERIRTGEDGIHRIRYRERSLLPGRYERHFSDPDGDIYYFEEKKGGDLIRSGHTTSLIPIHLEGRVTEYHANGAVKSESEYRNNMLVSNRNYNPDGSEYIHNVFYFTDTPALYNNGNEFFKRFVNTRLAKYDLPVHDVSDLVIIGAVVMESGELAGVKVLEGKVQSVNEFFKSTIELLPGDWEPARLNGEPVRCFIRFPFNINKNASSIQFLQLSKDGQLFWHH
jgi:hypothetical protein